MRIGFLIVPLALSACVSAEYHPIGTAQYSAIEANRSCAHAFDPVNREYAASASAGLIGVAVTAAAELPSPEYASAQQTYDACMAEFGWQKN
jgi:hypothetical protein